MGGGGLGGRLGQAGAGGIGSMGNTSVGGSVRSNEGPAGIATPAPPFRPPTPLPSTGGMSTAPPPLGGSTMDAGVPTEDYSSAIAMADGRVPQPPLPAGPPNSTMGQWSSTGSTSGAPVGGAVSSMSPAADAEKAMLARAGMKPQNSGQTGGAPPFRPPIMGKQPEFGGPPVQQGKPAAIGASTGQAGAPTSSAAGQVQRKPAPKPRVQPKPMA